jgi:hypothetical protein
MKATHNKASEGKVEWKFPCLGISITGNVVLFNKEREGTCILSGDDCGVVGEYYDEWNMANFTPLPSTESVTLQND